MPETIAATVRRLRTERGWSQTELAEKMGLSSPMSISDIERGRLDEGRIQLATLRRLAEAFGIAVGELLGE